MAATRPCWDIYAKSLIHHGHGYPLWHPDLAANGLEVQIGDVGWLGEGSFKHILRTRNADGAPQPHGVKPDEFEAFYPPNMVITSRPDLITQRVLYSRTIKNVEISGGLSLNVPMTVTSPGGNVRFRCADESGALLVLLPKGEDTLIESKRHIVTYLRTNIDRWEALANDVLGLELRKEEILFVSGVTKTSRWAVAAFHDSQRGAEGTVSCDLAALGSANVDFSISNTSVPGSWYRAGPSRRRGHSPTPSLASQTWDMYAGQSPYAPSFLPPSGPPPYIPNTPPSSGGYTSPGMAYAPTTAAYASSDTGCSASAISAYSTAQSSSTSLTTPTEYYPGPSPTNMPTAASPTGSAEDRPDQCIFFHYYKAKKRFWLFPDRIEAGAGPHELPPAPDDPGAYPAVIADDGGQFGGEFEMVPGYPKPYDPVTAVLDYILQNSEADIAIASDLDLYALFRDQDFPADVAEALAQVQPAIDIDESGVGTLSVDITVMYNRKRPAEEPEESPSKRRAMSPSGTPYDGQGFPDSMDVDTNAGPPVGGDHRNTPRGAAPPAREEKGKDPGRYVGEGSTHEGAVTTLAYSADGRYLASGSEDTSIIIWYAREGAVKRKLQGHDDTISALAFSPDGTILASASDYSPVKLWRIDALDVAPRELETDSYIRSLAFTRDGSRLLGGANDGVFFAWNMGNMERFEIQPEGAIITFIIFSADGRKMATGGTESACRIWEVANLDRPALVLEGHSGMVTSVSFSSDGRRVITGSDDFSCRIWSTETGEVLVDLHEHTGPVWSVCFSPDMKRIVSGSSDSTVKVCDSWTGAQILSLNGHDNMINCVAYSPDGAYIASASSDNTVRLWDAEDGTLLTTYNEHSDNVTTVQFSPDGRTLASGALDGTVYIRQLAPVTVS